MSRSSSRGPRLGLLWRLGFPLRIYVRHFPIQRGKGPVQRFLRTLLPHSGTFSLRTPGEALVELEFAETLGWHSLIYGLFERAELSWLVSQPYHNAVVIDVGANVGLFSCALAKTPGVRSVWAIEPLPRNIERLKRSLQLNDITNVKLLPYALGSASGVADLQLACDSAFASLHTVHKSMGTGEATTVAVEPLDKIWSEAGRPHVAAIKIDVEGAELSVLQGATVLLEACRPVILAEANSAQMYDSLATFLSARGYTASQPAGFSPWNHVFKAAVTGGAI